MGSRRVDPLTDRADPGLVPVTDLPGVGSALAATLQRLGLERLQDLWFHLPLRYEDKTRITAIADLRQGDRAQVIGTVVAMEHNTTRYRPHLKVAISDDTHHTLWLRFFHFHSRQILHFQHSARLHCFGEVRHGRSGLEMVHPQYHRLLPGQSIRLEERLSPVYPVTEGLGHKHLATLITRALQRLPDESQLELIPATLRARYGLISLRQALCYVHHPPAHAVLAELVKGGHPMQQRLAFEELLAQYLSLKRLRTAVRKRQAPPLGGDGALRQTMLTALPFQLTKAQQRVTREVLTDLAQSRPMLRLVQGDVGSGKTVVAALATLMTVEANWQVALTAPTELLAMQHLRRFSQWLSPLGVELAWLSGKVTGKARRQALKRVASGQAMVVIGTHALMQEGVTFSNLGLVIIDEQHRFGVQQRLSLRDKGTVPSCDQVPHQLVLTATPIPRTLAMSAYADLDISSIDVLPPGRTPVQTLVLSSARRAEVIERIHAACAQGRQVYWVCTLIEASEQMHAQAAEKVYQELCIALPDSRVGLIHGRLKVKEKQSVMDAFTAGELAVLVATTVIEVGVDVPNASLMVIENSERLGLAQLHQLRGRVGRGTIASSCVLLYQPPLGALVRERLRVMRQTNDGFRIAEQDLVLRGPGEVMGTRQTGQLSLRIADLTRDAHLLPMVQQVGQQMLTDAMPEVDRLVARWIGSASRYVHA